MTYLIETNINNLHTRNCILLYLFMLTCKLKKTLILIKIKPFYHFLVFRNERTESAEEARNEKIYIEKAEELYEQVWSEVDKVLYNICLHFFL